MRAVVADLTYAVGELLSAVRTVGLLAEAVRGMVVALNEEDAAAYKEFADRAEEDSNQVDAALSQSFSNLVKVMEQMSRAKEENG